MNTLYCYIAGAATSGDCAADKAKDRDTLQWSRHDLPGSGQKTTSYTCDSNSRFTKAVQAGGASNTTWAFT